MMRALQHSRINTLSNITRICQNWYFTSIHTLISCIEPQITHSKCHPAGSSLHTSSNGSISDCLSTTPCCTSIATTNWNISTWPLSPIKAAAFNRAESNRSVDEPTFQPDAPPTMPDWPFLGGLEFWSSNRGKSSLSSSSSFWASSDNRPISELRDARRLESKIHDTSGALLCLDNSLAWDTIKACTSPVHQEITNLYQN